MLKQRVITALLLAAVLLPALLMQGRVPLVLLVALMIGAAGWEWARLNGLAERSGGILAIAFGASIALAAVAWAWTGGMARAAAFAAQGGSGEALHGWRWVTLAWALGGLAALRGGPAGWGRLPAPLRLALGWLLLAAGAVSMLMGRQFGLNFLLSSMAIVWMSDICAYFGGRRFGRRKLAPSISPGKSWEGAVSGLLGAFALAWVWMKVEKRWPGGVDSLSLYAWLMQQGGAAWLAAALAALVALGIVGDLLESSVKRAAGAKDSSGLLPGHGGVLDRIDALLPVVPAAIALAGGIG